MAGGLNIRHRVVSEAREKRVNIEREENVIFAMRKHDRADLSGRFEQAVRLVKEEGEPDRLEMPNYELTITRGEISQEIRDRVKGEIPELRNHEELGICDNRMDPRELIVIFTYLRMTEERGFQLPENRFRIKSKRLDGGDNVEFFIRKPDFGKPTFWTDLPDWVRKYPDVKKVFREADSQSVKFREILKALCSPSGHFANVKVREVRL